MSKLTNYLKNFCYDWEMGKALKVRLRFRGEAACVAFVAYGSSLLGEPTVAS